MKNPRAKDLPDTTVTFLAIVLYSLQNSIRLNFVDWRNSTITGITCIW